MRNVHADEERRRIISEYGWIVINVSDQQPWSYTIGVWKTFRQPELLVSAVTSLDGQTVCNKYGHAVKASQRFIEGDAVDEWFEGRAARLIKIEDQWKPHFMGIAVDDYETEAFPALQAVWSDPKGQFPWEPGWTNEGGVLQFWLNEEIKAAR